MGGGQVILEGLAIVGGGTLMSTDRFGDILSLIDRQLQGGGRNQISAPVSQSVSQLVSQSVSQLVSLLGSQGPGL